MPELTDHELLTEFARNESEEAFGTLVTRYVNLVYSTALRFTDNKHHAEEITQAVFIILTRKAGGLSSRVVLSGWLYQTTRLTAANFMKAEIRRQQREQEAYMQSTLNDPGSETWRQIAPLLEDAMGDLGETDRNAVVLRFFENKTAAEAASILNLTEAAMHKRTNRALDKLRNIFSKHGVSSTTSIIAGAISAHSVHVAPTAVGHTVIAMAAAKGTAASASTLTLIKGALKIMAWTNAKTAVATSAAIILATLTGVVAVNYFQGDSPSLKLPTGQVNPVVAYGYSRYVVVLAQNGSLWSWGEERLGWPVLGLGNSIQNTTALRQIGTDKDWASVAVGDSHCLAIKSDGSLWAWGGNFSYQLGDGTKTSRSTPVRSIPGNDWKQAAAAGNMSFAIKRDGTLWAWGSGYLGNGNQESSAEAIQVGNATAWEKLWADGMQVVGLQSDGTLWFWGSLTGSSKDTNLFLVPTQISADTNWVDACFGYFTVLAIKSDGTLWSWGREANFYTQAPDTSSNGVPLQVGTDSDWASCSSAPACLYHLLRKKDGSLWVLDASEHRRDKPATAYAPLKFEKLDWKKDIAAYAAGGDDIGVIMTPNGEIWTWGRALGQFSQKDYFGPRGESKNPTPTIINKPWQLTNFVSAQ